MVYQAAQIAGRSAPPTVLATAATGIVDFMASVALDPDETLRDVGLSRAQMEDVTCRIPLQQYCRMFTQAAARAHRVNIGLEFGARYRVEQLGFLGYLSVSSPTLGKALESMTNYMPVHQQGTVTRLGDAGNGLMALDYAVLEGSLADRRQDAEFSLAVLLDLFRAAMGRAWAPEEVHFMHPKPEDARMHETVFGAPVYFLQNCNRILFDPAILRTPMPRADANLFELIASGWPAGGRKPETGLDLLSSARHHIEQLLSTGRCELPDVANRCGVPPWTLKRRLADAGLTFQRLVADLRRDLAIQYLRDYGMSVTEIALALGYSETSAFSRAFRQWTGLAPSDFARLPPQSPKT